MMDDDGGLNGPWDVDGKMELGGEMGDHEFVCLFVFQFYLVGCCEVGWLRGGLCGGFSLR